MINKYTSAEFDKMRAAGKLAAQSLDYLCNLVKEGVTSEYLDQEFNNFIGARGGNPACLGFEGYPKSICVSVNDVICHGIPNQTPFQKGDVIKIDIVVELDGFHGDTCRTVTVPPISSKTQLLIDCTYKSMMNAINNIKGGDSFGRVGYLIEDVVKKHGFSIAKDFCGHGIGKSLHEDPHVLHYAHESNLMIEPGMCFTIEPMINMGSYKSKMDKDGWTARTFDGKISAQFEHTLGILEDGNVEIFTLL